MRCHPYPKYKPSGIDWLGNIPEHWDSPRLGRLLIANDGGAWGEEPDGNNDTIVLRSTEQTELGYWQLDDPCTRKWRSSERTATLLRRDDLLVTKSSGSALHIGKTTLVTEEIAAMSCGYSNFMQRLRVEESKLDPRLAWYALNSTLTRFQFDQLSSSTSGLANINAGVLNQIALPIGDLPEQAAIVRFLDTETAKIDALVEEQRRLVELLKEKRQAVISHAVTKGLDPSASAGASH